MTLIVPPTQFIVFPSSSSSSVVIIISLASQDASEHILKTLRVWKRKNHLLQTIQGEQEEEEQVALHTLSKRSG